jgi:cell wall-associated NlpC family hydrolase
MNFPRTGLLALGLVAALSSCATLFTKPTVPTRSAARPTVASAAPRRHSDLSPRYHSAPPGSPVSNLIATARSYLDSPYSTGGNTSGGLDCSGFLCACFRQVGVSLPRLSRQQAEAGEAVGLRALRPGDLVFFATSPKSNPSAPINHVGLVTEVRGPGDVWFIHSSSSRGVREDNLLTPYWQGAFVRARRVGMPES